MSHKPTFILQDYVAAKKSALSFFKGAMFICSILFCSASYGQQSSLKAAILNYKSGADSIIAKYPAEKLYLQLNKPNYAIGDTIWFKAYLFSVPTLALSAKSGIMYITINNDSNTFTKTYRLPVKQGLSWGNISLADLPAGNYTLHAYTTWMRNFGQDCFFTKKITIAEEKVNYTAAGINLNPAALKRKVSKVQARKLKKEQDIDIQFLPEGGSLVEGLPAHIGFKAIGENGRGINISGIITDNDNRQIISFNSLHNGMGSFDINITPGKHYDAKVTLAGGVIKSYALPFIKTAGTVLSVINDVKTDSVAVTVSATNDIVQSGESYYLVGRARNIICYAAVLNFNNGGILKRKIAKSLFPSGITHFLLMTVKNHPLNERLVFINHNDNPQIETTTNKTRYTPHDSVAVQLTVCDASGNRVTGNFSVSVTDNSQVSIDSLNDNIINHILLSADVKGYLEQPGYYLQNNNEARQAIDNLLLTQGWVSYDLPTEKTEPLYAAEDVFAVKGKVLNGLQNRFKGVKVTLLSKSPLLVQDTLSDYAGRFSFTNFPQIDTPAFVLKAVNRHGGSFNVGIVMDDEHPPIFNTGNKIVDLDTIVDTALMNTAKNNRIRKEQEYLAPNGQMLKEVKIKAQKIVKDSQNLNGPGNADLVLDEADIEKEGKKSWLYIFYEKIKGFREGTFKASIHSIFSAGDFDLWFLLHDSPALPPNANITGHLSAPWFYIDEKPVKFIVDGVSIGVINFNLNYVDLTNYLKLHDAADIKGIEVNRSSKYTAKYIPPAHLIYVAPTDIDFIEITTRSGNGPVIRNTPGVYNYKPMPLSWPKEFYKPRYIMSDTIKRQPDNRSAISWEPNIITDKNGKANWWFYAADKPATYTVLVEGCDANGNLGYKMSKIVVKQKGQ